jgi:Tfp pilus assembly protein PilN
MILLLYKEQDGLSIAGLSIDLETLGTFLSMVNKNIPDKFLFCSISGKNIEIAGYRNETLDFIHIDTLGHDKEKYATVISEIINSIREHLLIDDDNGSEIPLFLDCDNISVKDELLNNSDMAVTLLEMIDTSSFKLTNQGKSIFSATGAALETLRPDIDDMNLLLRGKREKTKNSYFITIILILLLMVLYVSNDLIPYYKSKETLDELSESVEKLESSVNQAKKMKKKIKELKESIATIEDFGLRAFLPLEITKELTAIIPIDTWLTRLRIRTDTIELEGYSQSATTLIVKLEESRFFKKVEFSSPTIKDRRLKMDRFRIRADINDNRKESKEKKK